jgi:hypothetical protein
LRSGFGVQRRALPAAGLTDSARLVEHESRMFVQSKGEAFQPLRAHPGARANPAKVFTPPEQIVWEEDK